MRYLYTLPSSRKFKALQSYVTKKKYFEHARLRRNRRKTGLQNVITHFDVGEFSCQQNET